MGCWLGTDGITGASIADGEDCYALICFQRGGVYMPVYFPILGKYDELGKIEDIDMGPGGFIHDELLKYLNGKKKSKSIFISKDSRDGDIKSKTIPDWIENAERQNFAWKREWPEDPDGTVELVLFAKDVFDKAVEVGKKTELWNGPTREGVLRQSVEAILKGVKKLKKDDDGRDFMIEYEIRNKFEDLGSRCHDWRNNFFDILVDRKVSIENKKELLEKILSFSCFMHFMDDMRLNIGRTMGKGSQTDNLALQADFYKFAAKNSLDKAWERECEYAEYDEGVLKVGDREYVG